jgi:integrase
MRYFWPLPPKGNHKSFRIMRRENGRHTQVKDPRLDSINSLYKAGTIDAQSAHAQVENLVLSLRKAERPDATRYLDSNLDIFERYWKEEYEGRDILPSSRQTARASFKRALALLNELDLAVADAKVVQQRIFALPHKRRMHVVLALNALFKFVKRPHQFEVGKRQRIERVRHLSSKEFRLVLPKIIHPLVRTLAGAAFATGCRVGELFALSHYSETTRQVTIFSQVDRKAVERAPKTGQRTAVVIMEFEKELRMWLATPLEERLTIRNVRLADYVRRACVDAFPNQPDKHCHFYDLRHSYAIHFLSLGASLSLVAQALGNSEEVCRQHYTGFVMSDEGAALMNALQEKRRRA